MAVMRGRGEDKGAAVAVQWHEREGDRQEGWIACVTKRDIHVDV